MATSEKITQEKIINAVLSCAFEKGVGATSLSDIADKLNIKKASLYNHYENREAIIDSVVRHCSDTLLKTIFIPPEMDATAQKYSAETVLKGIVNRWFKLYTREPLFQIYSFLQGEKYFSSSAAMAIINFRVRLISQAEQAFKALSDAGKIKTLSEEQTKLSAELFIASLNDILDSKLIVKKSELRFNPDDNEPEDFTEVDALVFRFCEFLK